MAGEAGLYPKNPWSLPHRPLPGWRVDLLVERPVLWTRGSRSPANEGGDRVGAHADPAPLRKTQCGI